MIRSKLIRIIASRNPHLYQQDVDKIVTTILDDIAEALALAIDAQQPHLWIA